MQALTALKKQTHRRVGMSHLNRREFWAQACVLALGTPARASQTPHTVLSYGLELPEMLAAYLVEKANRIIELLERERAAIHTAAGLEKRSRYVREKFLEVIGGLPERTPLEARVTGARNRRGYRVENVMYQSRPNYWVTANLYIPDSGHGPFPGILSPCGHYAEGRMNQEFQLAYLNLVKAGFVVLAYDPIGQGERRQYWNPQTGQIESGLGPVHEHSMPGQLLLLFGEHMAQYQIWDGVRGLDYLLTRPEVDPNRIGCAGHSGGATLTRYILTLDPPVRCAAVVEEGAAHPHRPRTTTGAWQGAGCAEQVLFGDLRYDFDVIDMLASFAPRPLILMHEEYAPAFEEQARDIRERYRLLGAEEKFATELATDAHAWTFKLRQATTDWFSRWFYNRPGPSTEPDSELEPPENLYCSPNGSLRYSQIGDSTFSLILKKQAAIERPEPPHTAAEFQRFRRETQESVGRLIGYRVTDGPLGVRELATTPRHGYRIDKVEFLSEPGIYVPAWVFVPEQRGSSTVLYVSESGSASEGGEFGELAQMALRGYRVISVDVRGIGGTRPSRAGSDGFNHLFGQDTALAHLAWSIGEELFGMRVRDVVRSVDFALSRTDPPKAGITVLGRNAGALWAMYAAAFDQRIRGVIAESGLLSYAALAQVDKYLHGAGIFIRGVLPCFDLPQVAALAAPRPLWLLAPVDAMKQSVPMGYARRHYDWTSKAYEAAGAGSAFRIVPRQPGESPAEQFCALLEELG